MRAFVTGASGFVGGWLTAHLERCGDEVVPLVDGIDIRSPELATAIAAARPDVVYHLAGFAHVGQSWKDPVQTFEVNALGTLTLLEAARKLPEPPRVLIISSAEVYGGEGGGSLDESSPLVPGSPYSVSKIAAEYLGLQSAIGWGLPVVRVRPFNHIGPGQSDAFVVPGLAQRVAAAEAAGGGEIPVGNLTPVRDFTDVRDIVRAYRLLAVEGRSGEAYNVSSGNGVTIAHILELLVGLSTVPVTPVVDESLVRPADVQLLTGPSEKVRALTGWKPEIPLIDTLRDVLEEARKRL